MPLWAGQPLSIRWSGWPSLTMSRRVHATTPRTPARTSGRAGIASALGTKEPTVARALACDAECGTWAHEAMARQGGFIRVRWDETFMDFCSTDCLLAYFARVQPVEVVR